MHILKTDLEIGLGYFIRWSTASSLQRLNLWTLKVLEKQHRIPDTVECRTATTICKQQQMAWLNVFGEKTNEYMSVTWCTKDCISLWKFQNFSLGIKGRHTSFEYLTVISHSVLLRRRLIPRPVQKFPAFYKTRSCITVFTSGHLSLSRARYF
jgi:hypothetical protein